MKKLIDAIKKLFGKSDKPSSDSSGGFTLIELLVVIAVIGILAAAILVAIDPIEQIRRAQDSSRKQTISSIGRAAEAYYVNSASGTAASYPAGADWLSVDLQGEFKVTPTGTTAPPCAGGNLENNFCLKTNATPAFVVYGYLESKSERGRVTVAPLCGANRAIYVYTSALGKAGVVCAEPAAGYNGTLW